jgi:hypothetical protein
MLLTLPEIEDKIRELAAIIDAPEEFIPTFGSSNQSGLSHIEIQDGRYALIVSEKGDELTRETFENIDSLVFKVFQDISYSMACDLDVEGTNNQSFRERFLDAQESIMAKIYAYYRDTIIPKKEIVNTEDNTALSESRKKILTKSKITNPSLKTKGRRAATKKK